MPHIQQVVLRRLRTVAAAFCLLSVLTLDGDVGALRAQGVPDIRVGASNSAGAAVIYFAQEQGFFKKAGVTVDIEPDSNGSAAAAAVVSGALDVSEGNTLSIALAHEKGLPITFIAPIANYVSDKPTTVLMVDKTSSISSGSDLNGKTLAVNGLSNITQLAAEAWIDAHGGDSHSVHYVEMPFSAMGPALQRHTVDAVVIAEPAVTLAKANARVLGLCYDAIGTRFMINGWFATTGWIAKHAEAIKRFQRAMSEAANWGNNNPRLTAPILAEHTHIPLPLVENMTRSTYATALDPVLVQPQIDAAVRYGILHQRFPARELIYDGRLNTSP